MASGRSAIGAGQKQNSFKAQHLQHWLQQGPRRTEGIQIDQIKEAPIEIRLGKQQLSPNRGDLNRGGQRFQIGLKQIATIDVGIIDMQPHRNTACCS